MKSDNQSENTSGPRAAVPPLSIPCKVIQDSDVLPKSSRQWTRAKKCNLILEREFLQFENIQINYSDIESAAIHIYKSALFLEYGILSITSGGKTNYFGIKYDDNWQGELPFKVDRIHEETPFLLFRKSLIIVIIIYIFWELIKK